MKEKTHYAWAVCASCTIFIFVCIGIVTNGFSIYLPYLHDVGISNVQSSAIVNVRGAVALVLMFLIHRYYSLVSVRTGVALAAMCTFVAYLIYSFADGSFPLYLAGSALTGVSYAFGAMIILSDVLRRWFHKDFALAIGIIAAGTGIATTAVPIYVDSVIGSLGLSGTFLLEAFAILALIAAATFLFRNDPSDKGMLPYGCEEAGYVSEGLVLNSKRAKMPLRVWCTLGIVCLIMGALAGPGLIFLGDLFTTSGFDKGVSAFAISAIGILMFVGKIAVGAAIDRLGTYRALMLAGSLLAVGLAITPVMNGNILILAIALLPMGLGFSMMMLGPSNFAKDIAGPEGYFKFVKNFEIVYVAASPLFSFLPGVTADITGTYSTAYMIFGLMTVIALVLMTVHYRIFAKKDSPVKEAVSAS